MLLLWFGSILFADKYPYKFNWQSHIMRDACSLTKPNWWISNRLSFSFWAQSRQRLHTATALESCFAGRNRITCDTMTGLEVRTFPIHLSSTVQQNNNNNIKVFFFLFQRHMKSCLGPMLTCEEETSAGVIHFRKYILMTHPPVSAWRRLTPFVNEVVFCSVYPSRSLRLRTEYQNEEITASAKKRSL